MMKLSHGRLSLMAGCLALLVASAPPCAAQADDCTATVKITSIGVQNPDDTRLRNRTLTTYRYRIDAASSEKQCAEIKFNIKRSYKLRDGSDNISTEPGSLRIRGGKGKDFGEVGDKRGLPKMIWTAEDISCKRC